MKPRRGEGRKDGTNMFLYENVYVPNMKSNKSYMILMTQGLQMTPEKSYKSNKESVSAKT